jgi:hypothetical protein
MNSIPTSVDCAASNDVKPAIGRVTRFMSPTPANVRYAASKGLNPSMGRVIRLTAPVGG